MVLCKQHNLISCLSVLKSLILLIIIITIIIVIILMILLLDKQGKQGSIYTKHYKCTEAGVLISSISTQEIN